MKKPQVVLEPHCQQLVEESKRFTSTNFASPAEIRKLEKARYLDDPRAQEGLPSVSEQEITISRPDGSKLELIIMRPPGTESQVLPLICFLQVSRGQPCFKYACLVSHIYICHHTIL